MSKLKKYIIITFVLAWILQVVGSHDANLGSSAGDMSFGQTLMLCMFTPTLGAFLAGANIRDMGWNLRISRNLRLVLLAWLLPTVFQIAGAAFYYIVFPGDYDPSGEFLKEMAPGAYDAFKESGNSFIGYIAKEIFYSLTSFQTFMSVFLGLGEEIGWRGFMYPELKRYFGRTRGLLIGGVIHGAWHFPVMLLAGYEYGMNYIGAPVLGLFAFCVFTTSTGIISYWLYEKSESIWLPAIIHGTVNSAFNPYPFGASIRRTVFGPGMIGLIGVIPFAALAVYLLCTAKEAEEADI